MNPNAAPLPSFTPTRFGLWIDHLKGARIPLLIVAAGVAMTFWVD